MITAFVAHLKEKGWFDKFYVYLGDEPYSIAAWDNIKAQGAIWRAAAPDVKLWVTTTLADAIANGADRYIDVYVPIASTIVPPDRQADWRGYPRSNWDAWLATPATPAHDLWWYHACTEGGGCGVVGGSLYTGYANYAMDSPSIQNRMFPWLTRYYDFRGNLYYAYNYHWDHTGSPWFIDPWETNYWFGVNGDGILFYPGTPAKIGGTTHIPIESLRLKQNLLGMQDYELFKKLDDQGKSAFVMTLLNTIITNNATYTSNLAASDAIRATMANEILKGGTAINPLGSGISVYCSTKGGGNLSLFNIKGEKVKTIYGGKNSANGYHYLSSENRNGMILPTGLYFLQVRTEGAAFTRKLMIVR